MKFSHTEIISRIGSLENTQDIRNAVEVLREGGVVAVQIAGVVGIMVDGSNDKALQKIDELKEMHNSDKTFSSIMFYSRIHEHIDISSVHEKVRTLLEHSHDVVHSVGMVLHMRLPLKSDAVNSIPRRMRSENKSGWDIQNIDPSGRPVEVLVKKSLQRGLQHLAITTMNIHTEPEITSWKEAVEFIEAKPGVNMLLSDPQYRHVSVKGSFTIVDMSDLRLIREGFIPSELIEHLLGVPLLRAESKCAKFAIAEEFKTLSDIARIEKLTPHETRTIIHRIINGRLNSNSFRRYHAMKFRHSVHSS